MTATLSLSHLGCASTLNVHGDLIGLHSALQPCIDGAHGSLPARPAQRGSWGWTRAAGRERGELAGDGPRARRLRKLAGKTLRTMLSSGRCARCGALAGSTTAARARRRDDMLSPAKAC